MNRNLFIIIRREFMERVAKKSFIVTTLLMPVLMLLMMVLPTLIMLFSTPTGKNIAIADESGKIYASLLKENNEDLTFVVVNEPLDSVTQDDAYYGVLSIPDNVVDDPSGVKLYLHDGGSQMTEQAIANMIQNAVRDERMKKYDIEDLEVIIADMDVDCNLQTIRIQESGEEEHTSSAMSFFLGLFMTFVLYMFLLMYGQMVMNSIIEEKNNRVLELVVSSVKPSDLMLGKILGVGLVAVVQILIWVVLLCTMSSVLMPMITPESGIDAVAQPELAAAVESFSSISFILTLFGYILIFLIGGFLFYASIFAAIGSSVDNVQDASQLTSFAIIPIVIGLMVGLAAGNDPNSSMAIWTSIIPFTSPMVMLMRVPFGIPAWQIWVSVVVLYVSFLVMVWLAAKIYRVGIFMYGKKPNIKDLIRWATYK
ncbi:MAG: ABC transporter permease [Muribaculum sp.]|nr:ABC transporter permease [Muribaculum sp.]